jgi:hypothetical protein
MGNPNSPVYPFPQTDEDLKVMEEILKKKLDNNRRHGLAVWLGQTDLHRS